MEPGRAVGVGNRISLRLLGLGYMQQPEELLQGARAGCVGRPQVVSSVAMEVRQGSRGHSHQNWGFHFV